MNIGLVQYRFINGDIEYNLEQIEKACKFYGDKVDLLCFGEAFLQGFDGLSWDYEKDKDIAVSIYSDEIDRICKMSKQYDVGIGIGYYEKSNDVIYSSYGIIVNGEFIHNYRRISPGWKEVLDDIHYQEGYEISSFELNDNKFMIALCGDLWEEDYLKFKSDCILLWPIYCNYSLYDWQNEEKEYALRAGELSNKTFIVNPLSDDIVSHGGTFYIEEGKIVDKLPYDKENILIVKV